MILFAWSTWRSGCAASIPSKASTTTSFGSLMSFFMTSSRGDGWSSGRRRLNHGRLRVGQVDARRDGTVGRRVSDEAVGQRRGGASEELRGQVDGQLLPLHGATRDLLDQHRAE